MIDDTTIHRRKSCHHVSTHIGYLLSEAVNPWSKMTRIDIPVRLDVLPSESGGWTVTRDCIVDAEFNELDRARKYAERYAARAKKSGLQVTLTIHSASPPDEY